MAYHKGLLNHLVDDLISLMTQMQSGGLTLNYKSIEEGADYFMLHHKRRELSSEYTKKHKKYEKFHDFTVTVFAHTDPPSASYALAYRGAQIHYFKNLVQLQAHLLMYVSIGAPQAVEPVIDTGLSYSGTEAAKLFDLYSWPSRTKPQAADMDPAI